MERKIFPKRLKQRWSFFKSLMAVFCILVFSVIGAAIRIYTYGSRSSTTSAQAAIVLGAAVWGEEPSPVFRERINHALTLHHEGRVAKLIFTGGLGMGKSRTEAETAKRYAVRHGIPAADIFLETESRTTFENLRNARQVGARHHLRRFLIVSDPLHMKRAITMARDLGLHVKPSPTPTTRYRSAKSQVAFLANETYFYIEYRLGQFGDRD